MRESKGKYLPKLVEGNGPIVRCIARMKSNRDQFRIHEYVKRNEHGLEMSHVDDAGAV